MPETENLQPNQRFYCAKYRAVEEDVSDSEVNAVSEKFILDQYIFSFYHHLHCSTILFLLTFGWHENLFTATFSLSVDLIPRCCCSSNIYIRYTGLA